MPKNSQQQSPSQPAAVPFAQVFKKFGDRIECRKCGTRVFTTDLPHPCKQWRAR